MFLAEKIFGLITGRLTGISRKELPSNTPRWWQMPMTGPLDRMISVAVEMRALLVRWLIRLAAVAERLETSKADPGFYERV